jgi:futalosine hydrolase
MAPTVPETELLIKMLGGFDSHVIQGKPFYRGLLNDVSIVLSICGIGKVNAAHAATLLCERFQPSEIYILGVAGAYPGSGLDIGDVAVADREIYGDEGLMTQDGIVTMEKLGLPLASIGRVNVYNEFPVFVPSVLRGHEHTGTFITVSSCTGALKTGLRMKERFGAICENMEGAAAAHIGFLNNIPVSEIRGISNIVEERDGKPLDKEALALAARNAQNFLSTKLFRQSGLLYT